MLNCVEENIKQEVRKFYVVPMIWVYYNDRCAVYTTSRRCSCPYQKAQSQGED